MCRLKDSHCQFQSHFVLIVKVLHCHNMMCNSFDVQGIDLKIYVEASYVVVVDIYIFESLVADNIFAVD